MISDSFPNPLRPTEDVRRYWRQRDVSYIPDVPDKWAQFDTPALHAMLRRRSGGIITVCTYDRAGIISRLEKVGMKNA